jgi:hypothetical protein
MYVIAVLGNEVRLSKLSEIYSRKIDIIHGASKS